MINKTIGFIGGGRITRIFLTAFQKKGLSFKDVCISDSSLEVLERLKREFPQLNNYLNDNSIPASKDLVFIALHPPVIPQALPEITKAIKPDSIIISLAPKHTIKVLTGILNRFNRIVWVIPNGLSFINSGFNPIAYSKTLNNNDKTIINNILSTLGNSPEVPEEKLESYAVLTAMGPTYFWFQWEELRKIMNSSGITNSEFNRAIEEMINGAMKTYLYSGLSYEDLVDLIPGKPIKEDEETIKSIYQARLNDIYQKLKA